MNLDEDIVLQKVGQQQYLVRQKLRRLGKVVQVDSKWYYFANGGISQKGYDTQDEAVKKLIASTQLKKSSDYPRIHFRLSKERIKWFRGYAKRQRTSMSAIVKDYIEQLYQQDPCDGK